MALRHKRVDEYVGDSSEDEGFREWMRKVDDVVDGICGLSVMDLADQCYRDMYDGGSSPEDAAREALEDEGYDIDEY